MNLLRSIFGLPEGKKSEPLPKRNQINVIKPYLWNNMWVFDDPAVGLDKEALVAGMPELIVSGCKLAGIENPENGFVAVFSKDPFPGYKICLEWVREEWNGNVYKWSETGQEGWLCPALLKYFDEAPQKMYLDLRPAS